MEGQPSTLPGPDGFNLALVVILYFIFSLKHLSRARPAMNSRTSQMQNVIGYVKRLQSMTETTYRKINLNI
jgi:hypothetical protein